MQWLTSHLQHVSLLLLFSYLLYRTHHSLKIHCLSITLQQSHRLYVRQIWLISRNHLCVLLSFLMSVTDTLYFQQQTTDIPLLCRGLSSVSSALCPSSSHLIVLVQFYFLSLSSAWLQLTLQQQFPSATGQVSSVSARLYDHFPSFQSAPEDCQLLQPTGMLPWQ